MQVPDHLDALDLPTENPQVDVLHQEKSTFHPLVADYAHRTTAQFPRAYEGVTETFEGGRWRGITRVRLAHTRLAHTLGKSFYRGLRP
jgi:hypothetical protein